MRLARRGRLMRNFECRYVHRDGHLVPLSWMGVWSEPEQQHFFIGRDISDRDARRAAAATGAADGRRRSADRRHGA
jgi:hypothetical protein